MKLFCLLAAFPLSLLSAEKPNIVLIYADDLGFGDVSINGATAVITPNIDRIAKEGINFTAGHPASRAPFDPDGELEVHPRRQGGAEE